MEDLLKGLRNLGLKPPSSSQIWELLDDDEDAQHRLIRLLAFSAWDEQNETLALMGQDLIQEAVSALVSNFHQSIERQRVNAQQEQKVMEHNATSDVTRRKVKLPPQKALVSRQEAAIRRIEEERHCATQNGGYRPRLVFEGLTSFYSHLPLDHLQPISCQDLIQAPQRYTGTFLVGRVLTQLLPYVGVTFIVEDAHGGAIPVSVSHFTSDLHLTVQQASQALPIGTSLAIREPFLSLDHQSRAGPCLGKCDVGIRVDSPTDILVLDESSTTGSSLDAGIPLPHWLGLRHLQGIPDQAQDPIQTSKFLLESQRPGAAYRVLVKAKLDRIFDHALEARILYELRAWSEAERLYNTIQAPGIAENPEDTAASNFAISIEKLSPRQAAQRCALRQQQEKHGLTVSDVQSIYFASSRVQRLDIADYIGPIAVADIPGAGRGLVTTRQVDPGELLLCCKAVGASYPDDDESNSCPLVRLNLDNGHVSATSQVRAQTNLIHRLVDRPELALSILGLTAGPSMAYSQYVSKPYPVRTMPVLDSSQAPRLDIDAAYVDGVLRFNAFGPAQRPKRNIGTRFDDEDAGELSKSTMPHPLPAILNHACFPNVSSIFFSDIVTTRALTRLPKGTQIMHQYVRGEELYPLRANQLSKHGFQCECKLCVLDREDGKQAYSLRARILQGEARPIYERSRMLLKRVDVAGIGRNSDTNTHEATSDARQTSLRSPEDVDAHRDVLEALWQLVSRVDQTYGPNRGSLRPERLPILVVLIKHVALLHDTDYTIKVVLDGLSSIDAHVDPQQDHPERGIFIELPRLHMDSAIELILFIAVLLTNAIGSHVAQRWVTAAYYGHQCMIGGGREVFLDRWNTAEFAPALQSWSH